MKVKVANYVANSSHYYAIMTT